MHWEIALVEPKGSRWKQYFVQCSSCSTPVGVVDYFNLGAELQDRKQEIADLGKRLDSVQRTLSNIETYLQRLSRG
jgi:hypothetical protein